VRQNDRWATRHWSPGQVQHALGDVEHYLARLPGSVIDSPEARKAAQERRDFYRRVLLEAGWRVR